MKTKMEKLFENIYILKNKLHVLKTKLNKRMHFNLKCVRKTFSHRFSVFNICYGLPSTLCWAKISTFGHNKHYKKVHNEIITALYRNALKQTWLNVKLVLQK